MEEEINIKFNKYKGRNSKYIYDKNISDLSIKKENCIIFDDHFICWKNKNYDENNVIISKYFGDVELFEFNTSKEKNDFKCKNNNEFNNDNNNLLKTHDRICYNKIERRDNEKHENWKIQETIEYSTFYIDNKIKWYCEEHIDSSQYQFDYMKNVIQLIFYLKNLFDLEIGLAIKLLRICTLANMTFSVNYLSNDYKKIIIDIIKTCGGDIYEINNNDNNSTDNRIYIMLSFCDNKYDKDEVINLLEMNPNYSAIDVKFIFDSYYYLTDMRGHISDYEYTIENNNKKI